ncbi:MAG: PAS domain S-box protein [Actinobacteria bacterium]|nr:PAS domain S-box protein [Actinomycetota bacterium]
MSMNGLSARWPVALALIATAIGVTVVFLIAPESREARAALTHGTLFVCSVVATVVVGRHNRSTDGWQSGRALAAGLALSAAGTGGLLLWDVVGDTRAIPSAWDLGFLLFMVAVMMPAGAEYMDHFRPEDRREISVDVALITLSLAFLGYLLLRPVGADLATSMSTLVFATISATMFTTYAALALWVPTPAHMLQFVVFGAFSSATASMGSRWVRGEFAGTEASILLPLALGMLALAALAAFLPSREQAEPVMAPTRWGRPLLTSVSVASACAALALVADLHREQGMSSRQATAVIVVLAVGIALRILLNQIRSTQANQEARMALRQKEAALAATDTALDRVRDTNETLRQSEEHLRLVFETAVDGIVEMDERDTVLRANEAFCAMIGLPRQSVEGQSWTALAAAVAGADGSFASLPQTGQGTVQRQGQALYLESRLSQIPTTPPRRLLLVRDVTAGRVADKTIRSLFQFLQDRDEDRTRIMRRTNAAIESERNRVARDLHDGPVQGVSAASLSLEAALLMIKGGETERGLEVMSKIRRELAEEADALRRLMSGLRPPVLEERGLIPALRETLAHFGHDHGVATEFSGALHQPLSQDLETLAYRVVQEALSNAGKHAQASQTSVHVGADGSLLRIEIADDGVGFDSQLSREYLRMGRVGLASMRERVELASGTFTVHTTPGRGTTIIATLPIDLAPAREFAQT